MESGAALLTLAHDRQQLVSVDTCCLPQLLRTVTEDVI